MKWLRAFIVAALCLAPISAAFASSAPHESPVLSTDKMATSFELFSITNAKVLHSDAEVQEAWWQSIQQVAISTATFQGPGDIVSGAAAWGSVARVYSASLANTSTLLADLVDSTTGTVAVCTLRGSSTGFVDLTGSYCVGSLTPTAACLAAAGGACRVSKVYDQAAPANSGWINATNSQRPTLTFSAINGLPGITCTSAASSVLITSTTFGSGGTVPISSPYSFVSVAERTINTSITQALIGWSTAPNSILGFNNAAATALISADNSSKLTLGSVADSAFHAMIGVINATTTGVIAVDGTEASGTTATAGPAAVTSRICRFAGGNSLDGIMMEVGVWPSAISAGNRTSLNANMHGTSGYNF